MATQIKVVQRSAAASGAMPVRVRSSGGRATRKPSFSERLSGALTSLSTGNVAAGGRSAKVPQAVEKGSFMHRFYRMQIGRSSRVNFYETLELLLSNRVLLSDALMEMYLIESKNGKKNNVALAVMLYDCAQAIEAGMGLSEALAHWVPDQEAQLLSAGERSGEMGGALMDCVRIISEKGKIRNAILGGLSYPALIFTIAGVLLNQVATQMVPQFMHILRPEQWTGASLGLRYIAEFVNQYGTISLVVLAVLLIGSIWSLPRLTHPTIRTWLDRFPPWSLYRMVHGSTFLLNIAVMMRAGVRMQEALLLMEKMGAPWLKSRVGAAIQGINQGLNLGDALDHAGHHFPDERAVRFLRIISNQDGFEEKIFSFGDRWLEQSVKQVQNICRVMLVTSILVTGGLLALVILGITGIQQMIGT